MEGQPSDNYEERLYSVFKSFDVNNEESLDKSAVHNLCDALQLEERGAALVDTLFETRTGRVTFSQFRSGLLAVLGDGSATGESARAGPGPLSDDDSSGCEVAPRFVFGSKKYGRRSRPQAGAGAPATGAEPRASSASRLVGSPPPERPRARRSASAMEAREAPAPLEHDARVDRERALALCRDLRMDAIDARLVDRVFDEARAPDTTVGEFFERLNATLATGVEEVVASPRPLPESAHRTASTIDDDDHSSVAADTVIEAWEAAGIRRPRRLLAELGYTGASVPVDELERALDEERGAAAACPPAVTAALALARLRAARALACTARLLAERDKLRADVAAGERRSLLLAQEVDESHARLEAELRATLRRANARHAEEARRAEREAAAEAERAAGERARLEGELARRDEAEAGLRAELAAAEARALAEEARALAAEEGSAAVAHDRAELAAAVRAAEARAARAGEEAAAARALAARLEDALRENVQLRERVEELAAELAAPRVPELPDSLPPAGSLCIELEEAQATTTPTPTKGADTPAGVEAAPLVDNEKQKLIELVSELESSLEAMRAEYESCEEYWSGKVREERAAHDADAAAADARLADLTARVADFERRLRPPAPSLPPIAEQAALEAQVAALEAELAAARRAPPPAPPAARRPAPASCTRCSRTAARADAACRRLAARLAAADLLVKDLYVENCELALRRATTTLSPI